MKTQICGEGEQGEALQTSDEIRGGITATVETQNTAGAGVVDWEMKYQALNTVHSVFCTGLRKAFHITSPVPLSDILQCAEAFYRSHCENWERKYGDARHDASALELLWKERIEWQRRVSFLVGALECVSWQVDGSLRERIDAVVKKTREEIEAPSVPNAKENT